MAVLLGIDIGTSAVKALAIDHNGRTLASASCEIPILQDRPGWSEQDPAQWWAATRSAVREVTRLLPNAGAAPAVAALGLSGQMHGSVLLSRESIDGAHAGQCPTLRNAILWNDQRTADQCHAIERAAGGKRRLVEMVGNPALTGFTAPKLLWVREHEPHVWRRVAAVMLPKDYIGLLLTSRPATDVGDASGTLLFDPASRAWRTDLLARLDLDPAIFPPALESGAPRGSLTPWAARELGLPPGVPVAAGSGDNMTAAIGAGVVRPGRVLAVIGTSGVVLAHTARPAIDLPPPARSPSPSPLSAPPDAFGRVHTMCAATGFPARAEGWCNTGCTLSAGASLRWARDVLAPGTHYEELCAHAANVPPGCEGLCFLPYLTGERCPHPDPLARAGWIGATSRHTRAHLVRAVMEGVAFTMARILDIMREVAAVGDAQAAKHAEKTAPVVPPAGPAPTPAVRIVGGGARSALWRSIFAGAWGCSVERVDSDEGSALGAALLAGVAAGVWSDAAQAADACVHVTDREHADPARYSRAREVFEGLYEPLKASFARMAAV